MIPPDQVLYLLNSNKDPSAEKKKNINNHHGFADFFPVEGWGERLKVISMGDFLKKESQSKNGMLFDDPPSSTTLTRKPLWEYMRRVGSFPHLNPSRNFMIFPKTPLPSSNFSSVTDVDSVIQTDQEREAYREFQAGRMPYILPPTLLQSKIIHFPTGRCLVIFVIILIF